MELVSVATLVMVQEAMATVHNSIMTIVWGITVLRWMHNRVHSHNNPHLELNRVVSNIKVLNNDGALHAEQQIIVVWHNHVLNVPFTFKVAVRQQW